MDVVNLVHKHPLPGETIKGLGTMYSPGGKGANQAVAASQAGAQVTFIGAVGRDAFAAELISTLQGFGVRSDLIVHKEGTSGIAFITVDMSGENHIILSEGANGLLSVKDVEPLLAELKSADAVLLQNEIPWETTRFVMEEARKLGIRVYFNPAPALSMPSDVLSLVDTILLNETEAETLTGLSVSNEMEELQAAARLMDSGAKSVVLTLGDKGALFTHRSGTVIRMPAFRVDPVDTTAAGDTFIGALAAAVHTQEITEEALRFASAAAAIKVTRKGAQMVIPARSEIEAFLTAHPKQGAE